MTNYIFLGLIFLGICHSALLSPKADSKIAIIGGGPCGISLAVLLKNSGYNFITIYEAKDEVGGFIITKNYRGRAFEEAAIYIMGGSIQYGSGILPIQKKLIDLTRMKLMDASPLYEFSTTEKKFYRLPELLRKYPTDALKTQLIQGYAEIKKLLDCSLIGLDCVKCGVCATYNESYPEFGARKNLPAFADLLIYISDYLAAGPSYARWTGAMSASWAPLEIYQILKSIGVTAQTLPPDTPDTLKYMFTNDTKNWFSFEEGYQTFFQRLVEVANLNVKLSDRVTSLNRTGENWNVTSTSGSALYDFVFVTTSPQDSVAYMPDGPQKNLLRAAGTPLRNLDSFVATTDNYPSSLPGFISFSPSGIGMGTASLKADGTPFLLEKLWPANIFVIFSYSQLNQSSNSVWDVINKYSQDNLGFSFNKVLDTKRLLWPSGVAPQAREAWYSTWPTLQGDNGLFVFGEVMCGPGVNAILSCLTSSLPRYFPEIQKDALFKSIVPEVTNPPSYAIVFNNMC